MWFVIEPTGNNIRRLAHAHVAEVQPLLERLGYPPNWYADYLLGLLMAEGVGRERKDDADRDIVHHPV